MLWYVAGKVRSVSVRRPHEEWARVDLRQLLIMQGRVLAGSSDAHFIELWAPSDHIIQLVLIAGSSNAHFIEL